MKLLTNLLSLTGAELLSKLATFAAFAYVARVAGPDGFEGGITTRKYSSLTRVSRATAYRELADLLAKGCLDPVGGGGRSHAYAIRWNV